MRRFMRLEFSASLCEEGATFGPCQWDMMVRHMHPQTGPRDGAQVTGVTGVNIYIYGKYLLILLELDNIAFFQAFQLELKKPKLNAVAKCS